MFLDFSNPGLSDQRPQGSRAAPAQQAPPPSGFSTLGNSLRHPLAYLGDKFSGFGDAGRDFMQGFKSAYIPSSGGGSGGQGFCN